MINLYFLNKQITINDKNLIKDIKHKEFIDDINYKDIGKRKNCENLKEIGQISKETLFKNVKNVIMMILRKKRSTRMILKILNNY